ncbi:1-acyl-sn-glycerol-3-phosphate acyltransferase [Flavobacterium hiemivividum]|uniref:1-acyl-sn-glycerol-3-phosphate acyltransferase n=1 Tax=Flavobacterium hiemivividum TaxID=2541734 RepID=A0A4R5CYZ2_9FLAO|nr:1-acyl-sn-glycerol-3-phosphate acyltransferase [Flavobacterium hiemivividum]TDE05077.1 1-acyl-sn-glycerol-3-phosphate acyltransferase [Flavobacterium hiemivividum]
MQKFDAIRPFYDSEINEAILNVVHHPMMKALMNFTFPEMPDEEWKEQLSKTHSIRDFQCKFIYHSLLKVLEKSSDGLTTSGFEKLEKGESYLFISNHRDILLDTTLLNVALFENDLVMTASAIGDNLVQKDFLNILAKLNRNFLVKRGLTPREMLESSKTLSEYIGHLLIHESRSVWIAQREGRTKDGLDATNPGVLKMVGMGSDEANLMDYFKKIKVVPVSISYEYDPTDVLKIPQLLAEANNEVYIKEKNEDFMTLLSGVMGQKKGIHIHIGDVLDTKIDAIKEEFTNSNKQIQALAQVIDDSIIGNYKLWSTNYIAFDILNKTDTYSQFYTADEKSLFERRLEMRIDADNPVALQGLLDMYANPVVNKLKYTDALKS